MANVSITADVNGKDHVFTFEQSMIEEVSSTTNSDVSQTVMPGSGPGSNVGNDFNGVNKIINVSGRLMSTEASVVTGIDAPQITSVKQMKMWLEALQNGAQIAKAFNSNYEDVSVLNSSVPTEPNVEGQIIPATLAQTKIYVMSFSFAEVEGIPDKFDFSLQLFVTSI